jgi:hypothetical protein
MASPNTRSGWIDTARLRGDLSSFFNDRRTDLTIFGSTVNQAFEAFVFASVTSWYRERGWSTSFVHPTKAASDGKPTLRLKFSTRGRPENYTYVKCEKDAEKLQIRHQLRVATRSHKQKNKFRANMVLDVAVIRDSDLSSHGSNDFVENGQLVTFGEAKHMSAFAELVASFIGVVYELQPERLKRRRFKSRRAAARPFTPGHLSPFMFVSGILFHTAQGLANTMIDRGFDLDVYWRSRQLTDAITIK